MHVEVARVSCVCVWKLKQTDPTPSPLVAQICRSRPACALRFASSFRVLFDNDRMEGVVSIPYACCRLCSELPTCIPWLARCCVSSVLHHHCQHLARTNVAVCIILPGYIWWRTSNQPPSTAHTHTLSLSALHFQQCLTHIPHHTQTMPK